MSAPLSRGAQRDASLLLRALRTARHHLVMLGTSPGLNEAQRVNEKWIRRYLDGAEAELAGLALGGRPAAKTAEAPAPLVAAGGTR